MMIGEFEFESYADRQKPAPSASPGGPPRALVLHHLDTPAFSKILPLNLAGSHPGQLALQLGDQLRYRLA